MRRHRSECGWRCFAEGRRKPARLRTASSPADFQSLLGLSPKDYADQRRMERFKTAVRNGQDVTAALYDAGFGSSSRLYERANAELGMTPATYKEGGKGAMIRYSLAATHLGQLLVGATPVGLCAVRLGSDADELINGFDREFAAASRVRDDEGLKSMLEPILKHVSGENTALNLPLDVRSTAFQRRVRTALQQIPAGETRSYSELAAEIGDPKAIRAVAHACATNPVAVVVPCHRIVRSDGGLGGYRWGVERKEALLAQERASA